MLQIKHNKLFIINTLLISALVYALLFVTAAIHVLRGDFELRHAKSRNGLATSFLVRSSLFKVEYVAEVGVSHFDALSLRYDAVVNTVSDTEYQLVAPLVTSAEQDQMSISKMSYVQKAMQLAGWPCYLLECQTSSVLGKGSTVSVSNVPVFVRVGRQVKSLGSIPYAMQPSTIQWKIRIIPACANMLFCIIVTGLMLQMIRVVFATLRSRSNRCSKCGYSLLGLNIAVCPECGRRQDILEQ